jgi:hypothetical protein
MKTISDNEMNAILHATNCELLAAATLALALIKDHWIEQHGNQQVGEAWGALESAIENTFQRSKTC